MGMKSKIILILYCCLIGMTGQVTAQLKITDNANLTINSNAILDLESDSLGFLPPRMAINDVNSADPLIPPVTAGMTVYSTGGTVADGYYCWDGSKWLLLLNEEFSQATVVKTVSDTLLKSERMVLASNDVTITLPSVTSADNGLSITVKNIGTHTDLVIVKGYSGITIDGTGDSKLTRWRGETFTAHEGNWIIRERVPRVNKRLDVSPKSSWITPQEVIEYLNEHMSAPMVVQLCGGSYEIDETIEIDLPYPLTIQGLSFGITTLEPASGIENNPMFRCHSECYFKMLTFDGTALANYGDNAGEDAIRFLGDDTYHEVKDAYFLNFNKAIVDSSNTEIWIFDTDFEDMVGKAVEITGAGTGAIFKISESDFVNCARGIDLKKAVDATVSIINCGFYGGSGTDSAIIYRPAAFDFTTIAITSNTWNNIGRFIDGFDFTRSDGRDANAEIMNNVGAENKSPHCKLNIINNNTNVTFTTINAWYKLQWTNTSEYTCKWTINNNRITYQSDNKRDVVIIISGNIQSNSANQTLTIGIVKNNASGTRIGETTLRTATANQPYQFSTVIYLEEVTKNDYFELWGSTATTAGISVRCQDLNWWVNSQ
jgi:hypothetical protein